MIRPLRLARVAARAEVLVVRRQVAGIVRRAIMALIAGVFAMGALILAHIIAYMALRQYAEFGSIPAAAIVLGADFLLAAIFGIMASGQVSDPVLEEARQMRDQSLEQARQSLTLAAMVAPLTRVAADMGLVRMMVRLLGSGFRREAK
jgi:hypothetical protein